jgi:acetyltransferase-like isoleucine patch superfamily enzyme
MSFAYWCQRIVVRALSIPDHVRRRFRAEWLRGRLAACGRNFLFDGNDLIGNPENIFVGNDVFIAGGAVISVAGNARLRLGDGVMFGPRVIIMGGDHDFMKVGTRTRDAKEGINRGEIALEEDVWCGARVTILKQVTIGEGAVVAAGSVVTKSLPPYTICAGIPCRPVRLRFSDEELREHLRLLGRSPERIDAILRRRQEEMSSSNGRQTPIK